MCYWQWEAYLIQKEEQYNTDFGEEETLRDMKEIDWIFSEMWNRNLSHKSWQKQKKKKESILSHVENTEYLKPKNGFLQSVHSIFLMLAEYVTV